MTIFCVTLELQLFNFCELLHYFRDLSELIELATEFFELHNYGKPEGSSQSIAIIRFTKTFSCE